MDANDKPQNMTLTDSEIQSRLEHIIELYGDEARVMEIMRDPQNNFIHYDHDRILEDAERLFGNLQEIKKVILKFPPFASYDLQRVVREATLVYKDEEAVKKAIVQCPQFACRDHQRVVRDTIQVYGRQNSKAVKEAILRFPSFASLDHERVVREATEVYHDEQAVKKAIVQYLPFAGLDHQRVVRQNTQLLRLVGLGEHDAIGTILKNPRIAGCSVHRDVAYIDIFRQYGQGIPAADILHWYINSYTKSPYIPNSDKRPLRRMQPGDELPKAAIFFKRWAQKYRARH